MSELLIRVWRYIRRPAVNIVEDYEHIDAWTNEPSTEWFVPCSRCGRHRLRARYLEFYAPIEEKYGWWRECLDCSVKTLTIIGLAMLIESEEVDE